MSPRRWLAGALLIAALLLAPGRASAAPLTITEYQELLRGVVSGLEAERSGVPQMTPPPPRAARFYMATHLEVQTPSGLITVDLSPLQQGTAAEALPVAQAYLAAAEANLAPTPDPGARDQLAQIMAAQKGRNRLNEWLNNLLRRIFAGRQGDGGVIGVLSDDRTPWIAGAIGVVGLSVLGYSLFRSLRGHGAGADLAARLGRGPRPERPLTPEERWAEAQALATAGEWTAALRGGYLALLQALDKQGHIRYLPAQTNREHERQLRRSQPGLAPRFATLTALVDSRLFGGIPATADDFEAGRLLIEELWREGDALSRRGDATTGASSSAPSP